MSSSKWSKASPSTSKKAVIGGVSAAAPIPSTRPAQNASLPLQHGLLPVNQKPPHRLAVTLEPQYSSQSISPHGQWQPQNQGWNTAQYHTPQPPPFYASAANNTYGPDTFDKRTVSEPATEKQRKQDNIPADAPFDMIFPAAKRRKTENMQHPSNVTISTSSMTTGNATLIRKSTSPPSLEAQVTSTGRVISDPALNSQGEPRKREYKTYTFAQRVQALTMLTHEYTQAYIEKCSGVKPKAQRRIRNNAEARGYDFEKDPIIQDFHVVQKLRTGRPKGSKNKKHNAVKPANGEWKKRTAGESDNSSDEEEGYQEAGAQAEQTSQNPSSYGVSDIAQNDSARQLDGITAQLQGIQHYLQREGNS